jgi:uncharacterized FAD-dependent dehydrogenase
LYDIPKELRSKNEVLKYVYENVHPKNIPMVMPEEIIQSILEVLNNECDTFIPDMIPLQTNTETAF